MTTKLVNGERLDLTPLEEIDLTLERAASLEQAAIRIDQAKRDKLIAYEKEQALETLVTTEVIAINNMDDIALNIALSKAGLS